MSSAVLDTATPRRGHLVLEKKVFERIASHAASQVRQAGGTSGGVLGFGTHGDLTQRPSARVELHGRTASVSLDLAVAYPTAIRAATERVRLHVVDRIQQLTGVEVTRVDITVSALTPTAPLGRGVA